MLPPQSLPTGGADAFESYSKRSSKTSFWAPTLVLFLPTLTSLSQELLFVANFVLICALL